MPVTRFRPRGDTKANWTALNPILKFREMGIEYETTVGSGPVKVKFGDGIKHWNDLDYGLTDDVAEKVIKEFTTPSDENPALSVGDTIKLFAGKIKKKFTYLENLVGNIRGVTNLFGTSDPKTVAQGLQNLVNTKFDKSNVYTGLDSTSTTLAASGEAVRQVNVKCDNNASAINQLNSNLGNFEGHFNFLSADSVQFDAVNNNAYFKTVKDNIIFQLGAEMNGMSYGKIDQSGWHLAWNVALFNLQGFDAFYDPNYNACLIKWRIRDDLHYQLVVDGSIIGLDRFDGVRWTRLWTK